MKIMKLNKKNITKILIDIQDYGNCGPMTANAIATRAINSFGLQREHQKQTGNSPESYRKVK